MSSVSTQIVGRVSGRAETTESGPDHHLPAGVVAIVGVSWTLLIAAQASGSRLLDHDAVFEGGRAAWMGVGLFLLGWQPMVVAMMLPASFPAIRQVASRRLGVGPFLLGFGAVWTAFGCAALNLDSFVHRTVDSQPWLAARPALVAAGLLAVVGLVQLVPLTSRCLTASARWDVPPPGQGDRPSALVEGARYGVLSLGCDGGLMFLMFGLGKGSVVWMAVLGTVMVVERASGHGAAAHRGLGAVAMAAAAAILIGI